MPGKSFLKIASTVLVLFVFACVFAAQFSASAQEKTNPVKPSPESLAKGKKLYSIDCAMCHADNGNGKNDMDVKNVPDFTNPDVQQKASDGKWFQIIHDGKGDMPPEAQRAKTDDDLWNLVNYCRTFGKK